MNLIFSEDINSEDIPTAKMREAAELVMERENLISDNTEVGFSFVSPEEIRSLNAEYRSTDSVTDVLSFPMYGAQPEIEQALRAAKAGSRDVKGPAASMSVPIGDVVICRERAEEQAAEYGHSLERELVYLFVHSMFHLLGYDHVKSEDKTEMRRGEDEIMERLGILR